MKRIFPIIFITSVSVFGMCNRESDSITHINCDGLITDTSGTGDNGRIYMPNAFTPNADGVNDISRPITQNIVSIVFTIYDENNNVVFTTNQLGQGWATTVGMNTFTKYYYRIQTVTVSNRKIGQCGELYKLTCFPSSVPKNNLHFEDQLTLNGFTGPTIESLPSCP
jgi:gliding motility-associated-like protein